MHPILAAGQSPLGVVMPMITDSSEEESPVREYSSFRGRQLPMIAHALPRSQQQIHSAFRKLDQELHHYSTSLIVKTKHAVLQLSRLSEAANKANAVMEENSATLAQCIELRELPMKLKEAAEKQAAEEEAEKPPPPPPGMYM